MKLSAVPLSLGFLSWLLLEPQSFSDSGCTTSWSYGPYVLIAAIVLSIANGMHFTYYNGKKRLAQNYARYISVSEVD
jgi:hypothetical protein